MPAWVATLACLAAVSGAGAQDSCLSGILVLHPNTAGALTLSGDARVTSPAVFVNSTSTSAVSGSGTSVLATTLNVAGGCSFSGSAVCTGTVARFPGPADDPYSGRALPPPDANNNLGTLSIGDGSRTVSPGYYSGGISISGQGTVVFNPGVYVLGGNFTISGGVSVRGEGVCFVMLKGGVALSGHSELNFTPPQSGDLAGVVIAQPASNTAPLTIAGGSALSIQGAIWAPGAAASFTGNSESLAEGPLMGDFLVTKQLKVSGCGMLIIGRPMRNVVAPQVSGLYD